MASNDNSRGKLLTAGGVLSIIAGAFEVISGAIMLGLTIAHRELFRLAPPHTHPGIFLGPFGAVDLIWLIIVGVPIFAMGIVAIVGGVSAISRRSFGLSLAGAICALPSVPFGILAVIFVALGKREFGATV